MITGAVNAQGEATIPLVVRDAHGQEHEITAVIDTGFTGFLTLPAALIASLGLAWRGREQGMLGDGSLQLFEVYEAVVIWDGRVRSAEANGAEVIPLVGMGLIHGHELRIRAVEGGVVAIEPLPS